jgi:hypothetical protein
VVIAEHPAPVGEYVAGQLLGLGGPVLQADHPGHVLAGGQGVRVAGTEGVVPVGEHITVLLLGLTVLALQLGQPGQGPAGGQRVGMRRAQDAAPGGKHVPAQLVGFAELAAQAGQPGEGLTGGQGVGVIVTERVPAAAEDLADQFQFSGSAGTPSQVAMSRVAPGRRLPSWA